MIRKIYSLLFLLFCIALFGRVYAQDINNVNVNTMPQSQVDKAKNAMSEAGLTPEEAADLARQRGASEQQIRDMLNRMQEGNNTEQTITDSVFEASEDILETQEEMVSTRKRAIIKSSRVFGSYLFNSKNLTFEPSVNIQTPSNYELNIGDEVLINIWGNSQSNYQLKINRNGQLLIPDVGPVYVAGLTFSDAETKIKDRLTSIYEDMGGDSPNTFAQINMGQLHSIKINLVGEVSAPGTYTLPATATVFNALYLSGGPNSIGSFRNINVIRDNKTIKTIDVYNFLIDADPSGNIALKDNDIVFIPPAIKKVEIDGFFKRTGIFELIQNENLEDLIRFAGGFADDAYQKTMQIYRQKQNYLQIIDVPKENIGTTVLQEGDKVKNKKVFDNLYGNRVTIIGNVYRPGEYEWTENLTLVNLIDKANGVISDVYTKRGLITRLNADLTTKTIPFNVEKVINGEETVVLYPEDIITIKSHFEIGENPYVSIRGEVLNPVEIPWSDSLTVSDMLFLAGGFTEAADSSVIEVARRLTYDEASRLTDTLVHIFTIHHSRDLAKEDDQPFYLEPYDEISVKRAPGFRNHASVTISGEVVYSGNYALRNKNQRLSDLVDLAYGITPQAYLVGATLLRKTSELGTENIAIDLQKILENPKHGGDLLLKDGDILHIPEYIPTVKITGLVQNPFSITYEKGRSAKYYINCTGGFGDNAFKRKTYVIYPNGYTEPTKSFMGIKLYPEVMAGSVVVVPQKPDKEKINNSGMWLSIASTMATIAVSIATASYYLSK